MRGTRVGLGAVWVSLAGSARCSGRIHPFGKFVFMVPPLGKERTDRPSNQENASLSSQNPPLGGGPRVDGEGIEPSTCGVQNRRSNPAELPVRVDVNVR